MLETYGDIDSATPAGEPNATAGTAEGQLAVVVGGPAGWLPPRVLAPWLGDPDLIDRLTWMSEVTGLDLIHLGTVAGQRELSDPSVSQPLAAALGIVAGERLLRNADPENIVMAGHGTGEITVAVLAGILDPSVGLRLAVRIGRAQAAAAAAAPGGQVALLGGDPAVIEDRASTLGLTIAAYNGGGATVLSGPHDALGQLISAPPRHTRAERLPATGPWSSPSMITVAEEASRLLTETHLNDPHYWLLSGSDGRADITGFAYVQGFLAQLTGPVRWDLIMAQLDSDGVRTIMELPPAGALTGLVSRGMPGVSAAPIRTPADADLAAQRCRTHTGR